MFDSDDGDRWLARTIRRLLVVTSAGPLSSTDVVVAVLVATRCAESPTREFTGTVRELAVALGKAPQNVGHALAQLELEHVIRVEPGGRGRPSVYRMGSACDGVPTGDVKS